MSRSQLTVYPSLTPQHSITLGLLFRAEIPLFIVDGDLLVFFSLFRKLANGWDKDSARTRLIKRTIYFIWILF